MKTQEIIKYIILGIGLCLIQFIVLNKLNLSPYIQPQILILLALLLPMQINKAYQMLIIFGVGLTADFFLNTFGISAFCLLLITYYRGYWLPKEDNPRPEFNVVPALRVVFNNKWIGYVIFLTFGYHLVFFILEYAAIKFFYRILLTAILSSIVSIFIQWIIYQLFLKHKY